MDLNHTADDLAFREQARAHLRLAKDDYVRKQDGISFLLIDMRAPGVTLRPILMLDQEHEVNEVFFDNVEVPLENLVGQENRGGSEIQQTLTELMLEAAGPAALPFDPAYLAGAAAHSAGGDDMAAPLAGYYFNYRKTSIYGGSNEIQKNIITQMILGL